MLIRIIVTLFCVLVIANVAVRFRRRQIRFSLFVLWSLLWIGVAATANWSSSSDWLAHMMGMGRGMDLLVFLSILAIFYALYRVYSKVEKVERKLTQAIREEALRNVRSETDEVK